MRVYPVWVCLLGACFDPSVPAAAPCSDIRPCPGGQHCQSAICVADSSGVPIDAGIDAAIPGQPDPPDASAPDAPDAPPVVLGCPPPSATLDDDGDGVADAVDPCPLAAGSDDGDGDGVSGICDRGPAPDKIMCFEGFAGGVPADWGHENDTAASSAVVLTGAPEAGLEPTFPIGDPSSVLVAMTFLPPFAADQLFELDLTDQLGCQIIGPTGLTRWILDLNGAEKSFTSPAQAFTIALGHVGDLYTCSVYASAGTVPLATLTTSVATDPAARAALIGVFMAKVQVESVLVVGAP